MSVLKNFSTTDKVILCGSTVILIVLSYLLYDDTLLVPSHSGKEPLIGTLSHTHRDVRRKNNDNFIWLPGNNKDQVYNKDSIFTGPDSQASIRLTDGSVIQIQENSLMNLNLKNGQMELDLRFGQLTGNGNTPLKIKTGEEEYTIQGKDAKFEINRSKSGAMDVKVLSGDAEIRGKNGTQKLKPNESLQITKKGVDKKEGDARIELITQNDAYLHRSSDKAPLSFEWKGQGPLAQYNIEISKTEDFKKILSLHSTQEQNISLVAPLKEGTYYWRVQGLNVRSKPVATSKIRKFYVSYLATPKLLTPENNGMLRAEILTTSGPLRGALTVTWEGHPRHLRYHWQISEDQDFHKIVAEKTLRETQIRTPELHSGTYFTRVKGFDKEQHPSPWSAVHAFNFEVTQEPKPPAPLLTEKNLRFTIPKLQNREPSAAPVPQMSWTKVDVAKNYRWEIAKSPRFADAQAAKVAETKIAWNEYKPGKYYFRVFSTTPLGQNSDPSETGVLEVYGEAPVLNPVPATLVKETNLDAIPSPQEVEVQWSPISSASSYLLQWDEKPDFSEPQEQVVNSTQAPILMNTPGAYHVRVKALNENSEVISEFSNVQQAIYTFKKTLKAPQLVEPYDKNTIFLQKDMEPWVWLEWQAVSEATNYQLEVSTKADFSQLILTKTLNETRFLVRKKIPYGLIYWRVRALGFDESLNSEWAQRQFLIYHQKNSGF